jgi:DNA polymerase III delta prime subunit
MLFYGPSGAGKKTRIMAMLRDIFGPGVERVKLEHRTFKTPTGRAVEMTTVASVYHIEINPGDAGIYDRFVVQELIKEMAAYNPMSGETQQAASASSRRECGVRGAASGAVAQGWRGRLGCEQRANEVGAATGRHLEVAFVDGGSVMVAADRESTPARRCPVGWAPSLLSLR